MDSVTLSFTNSAKMEITVSFHGVVGQNGMCEATFYNSNCELPEYYIELLMDDWLGGVRNR